MKVDATHPGDSKQTPRPSVPSKYSRLDINYDFGNTHRFGEYGVNFCFDTQKNDHIILHTTDETRSYTMKAPLMQSIVRHKEYFNVPMQALLPNNFDAWFQQPANGDDVPDYVNCTDPSFISRIRSIWDNYVTNEITPEWDTQTEKWGQVAVILKAGILLEMFFSHGSLLASLGCKLEQYIYFNARNEYEKGKTNIDTIIQKIYNGFKTEAFKIGFKTPGQPDEVYDVNPTGSIYVNQEISFHECLEMCRQNLNFYIQDPSDTLRSDWIIPDDLDGNGDTSFTILDAANTPIDMARLHAYQMVCAHYFTNDSIDYVYSADLYRNLLGTYYNEITTAQGLNGAPQFNWNGIGRIYDWCSAHIWKELVTDYLTTHDDNIGASALAKYLTAVFSYRKSLRFIDYFTGAKSQPIATGDYDVSVNANKVSIIDVTKGIQMQRLGNAVQRIGKKAEEYLQELFPGVKVGYDYHNPEWLAKKTDTIFGQETENTGDAQLTEGQTVTTTLKGQSNNYAFEFSVDRPGIIIGITYFDIKRLYTQAIERQFFIKNRYDMLNPYLQNTGDQYVYLEEIGRKNIGSDFTGLETFAYQMKYQEYRNKINQAAGGFVHNLPGWVFLDTFDESWRHMKKTITPEFIRCHNAELDPFYISLLGDTLEKYFHFICLYTNKVTGKRQVTAVPKIM